MELSFDFETIRLVCLAFVAVYIMIKFKKITRWIKSGIEGEDGKLSNKELTVFIFTSLFGFMIISTGLLNAVYPDAAWYMTSIGAGIISAVNALPDVLNKK